MQWQDWKISNVTCVTTVFTKKKDHQCELCGKAFIQHEQCLCKTEKLQMWLMWWCFYKLKHMLTVFIIAWKITNVTYVSNFCELCGKAFIQHEQCLCKTEKLQMWLMWWCFYKLKHMLTVFIIAWKITNVTYVSNFLVYIPSP